MPILNIAVMTNLYIDCEWFVSQKIFLVGYAYSLTDFGQLHGRSLTRANILKLLRKVDGYIFFYGPDIAMLEKNFNINIRDHWKCINLLRVFKTYKPRLKSFKLENIEKHYKVARTTHQYKQNIFFIFKDWYNENKKAIVLKYNMEDVINLLKVKRLLCSEHSIKPMEFLRFLLK